MALYLYKSACETPFQNKRTLNPVQIQPHILSVLQPPRSPPAMPPRPPRKSNSSYLTSSQSNFKMLTDHHAMGSVRRAFAIKPNQIYRAFVGESAVIWLHLVLLIYCFILCSNSDTDTLRLFQIKLMWHQFLCIALNLSLVKLWQMTIKFKTLEKMRTFSEMAGEDHTAQS